MVVVVVVVKWKMREDQEPLGGGDGDDIGRAKWQFIISERWEIINRAWIKPKRNLSSGLIKSKSVFSREGEQLLSTKPHKTFASHPARLPLRGHFDIQSHHKEMKPGNLI